MSAKAMNTALLFIAASFLGLLLGAWLATVL